MKCVQGIVNHLSRGATVVFLASLLSVAWAGTPLPCVSELQRSPFPESVWQVRRSLFQENGSSSLPWQEYLSQRYLPLINAAPDELQRLILRERIAAAAEGGFGELGELEVAERYFADPTVDRVVWIARTWEHKTPDLGIHYKDGSFKLVEVKTRTPLRSFKLKDVLRQVRSADAQIAQYQESDPAFAKAPGEVVLVFAPSRRKLKGLRFYDHFFRLLAQQVKSTTPHLTQVTILIHNRPYLQIVRSQGAIRIDTLSSPEDFE